VFLYASWFAKSLSFFFKKKGKRRLTGEGRGGIILYLLKITT
jgi:hypothetical protein